VHRNLKIYLKEAKMNNKCVFCGNSNFSEKKVQYIYKHNYDFFIIVNGVPYEVCSFCSEQYFKGEELEKIEKLFFEIHQNKRISRKQVVIPVEEYSEIFV
jgi:YgiT-type zinc finger domain-containing protein